MPKLTAGNDPQEAIIRVEVTAEMINETNEDGSYKYDDDKLREWLTKLRGDREVAMAKVAKAKSDRETRAANKQPELTDDDL